MLRMILYSYWRGSADSGRFISSSSSRKRRCCSAAAAAAPAFAITGHTPFQERFLFYGKAIVEAASPPRQEMGQRSRQTPPTRGTGLTAIPGCLKLERKMISLDKIVHHLDSLTKPPGSLGRLEELAARLCLIQQSLS